MTRSTPEITPIERRDAQRLREHLAEHAEPCPACGYLLHRIESDRCPECGVPLRMRVGRSSVPWVPWLVMVIPAWMACGEAVYAVFWLAGSVTQDTLADEWTPIDALLQGLLIICIPVAVVATTARPRFVRWTLPVQWAVALAVASPIALILMVTYTYYTLIQW